MAKKKTTKTGGTTNNGGAKRRTGSRQRSGDGQRPFEDESDFLRRIQWFAEHLGERDGSLDADARLQGLAQGRALRAPNLVQLDPGGERPDRGYELITPKGVKARVLKSENRVRTRASASSAPPSTCVPRGIYGTQC